MITNAQISISTDQQRTELFDLRLGLSTAFRDYEDRIKEGIEETIRPNGSLLSTPRSTQQSHKLLQEIHRTPEGRSYVDLVRRSVQEIESLRKQNILTTYSSKVESFKTELVVKGISRATSSIQQILSSSQ